MSARSRRQTITVEQSEIGIKTSLGNGCESEKTLPFSTLSNLPINLHKYYIVPSVHPVFYEIENYDIATT
jgi:hypothetical protein